MERNHCSDTFEATLLKHLHKSRASCKTIHKNGCAITLKIPNGTCRTELNSAGLNHNLNFKLLTLNKTLQVTVGEGEFEKTYVGKVNDVGIDYIELKKNNGNVITLLKNKISSMIVV